MLFCSFLLMFRTTKQRQKMQRIYEHQLWLLIRKVSITFIIICSCEKENVFGGGSHSHPNWTDWETEVHT